MAIRYDYVIVGAGLTGSVTARQLTDAGLKCLLIDRRPHAGGNVYDESIDGTIVHRYGAHIFHTNSRAIWDYVNRYSEWTFYEHRVKARHDGRTYSFPPNLMTYEQLGISPDDTSLRQVLFDAFFRGYSTKQWGRSADDVPDRIISRIPVRFDYDDRYFNDRYQGLPASGYTAFVNRLVDGIDIELGTDYFENKEALDQSARRVIYTGPVDSLYGHDMGRLEYRSLRFVTEITTDRPYQGAACINYTDLSPSHTRINEWSYFGWQRGRGSVITTEYPDAHTAKNEPYYPVNDEGNNDLHRQYKARAEQDGYIVAGRLGDYRYYDMDQAIGAALRLAGRLLA